FAVPAQHRPNRRSGFTMRVLVQTPLSWHLAPRTWHGLTTGTWQGLPVARCHSSASCQLLAASYLITAIVSPVATEPPSDTPSSCTRPDLGAVISFSIFIASITAIRSPSSTSAPFLTATLRTVPWIGDTSSPAAPPPEPPARSRRFGGLRAAATGPAPLGVAAAPITFTSNLRPETSTA